MKQLDNILNNLENKEKEICTLIKTDNDMIESELEILYLFFIEFSKNKWMLGKLLADDNYDILIKRVNDFVLDGEKKKNLEEQILGEFDKAVFTFDSQTIYLEWNQTLNQCFFSKMINQNKILKRVRLYAKQPNRLSKYNIKEKLESIIQYHELERMLTNVDPAISDVFGMLWNTGNPEWTRMEHVLNHTMQLKKRLIELPERIQTNIKNWLCQQDIDASKHSSVIEEFIRSYEQYKDISQNLKENFSVSFNSLMKENDWKNKIINNSNYIKSHLEYIKSWISLLTIYDNARSEEIGYVAEAIFSKKIAGDEANDIFTTNITRAILTSLISKNDILCNFQGAQFEKTIDSYKEVLSKFEIVTIKELVAVLSEKIPNTSLGSAGSSEIGILQKAIKSGGRAMSVRKLFDSIPNLLRKICPCMLMSPMSVAQFIDPKFPKFDLVIFDEASQLPTSEAVGAIARGENVVVVGDPKQLPPTSFFSSSNVDEENIDIEDLESVLDDCLAINMPQQHLLWHYRSRHESLIAYSNMKYYENKLYTFPSPNDLISKVEYVPVEGFYDRSGTRQNVLEAQKIVKEIMRRLTDEELRNESIGVVTFSSVQQSLVEDLLLDEFANNPEIEKVNNELSEPLFVKNLENVQGDERDIILFSICYAPDKDGKMSMNFGPINREGGWRRLNVAISRARKKMIVYSTLKPENIDLSRTKSDGVAGLKGFLEYAMHGKNTLAVRSDTVRKKNTRLAQSIAKQINENGYNTNFEIGCSDYRVDIGVVDPEDTNQYILGIMLDGDNYNMAHTLELSRKV